jgi:hypothetical protein
LTVSSGAAGEGNGLVTLHAAPSATQVTGHATIAGQPVQVTESANPNCGAADASARISVTSLGWNPVWNPPGVLNKVFGTTFTVGNFSSSVVRQVNVVFLGLPKATPAGQVQMISPLPAGLQVTQCYSSQGNDVVSLGDLAPGQIVRFPITVLDPNGTQNLGDFATRVVSGAL